MKKAEINQHTSLNALVVINGMKIVFKRTVFASKDNLKSAPVVVTRFTRVQMCAKSAGSQWV